MTYKEAEEVIRQSQRRVSEISETREPKRHVIGFFIAPLLINSDIAIKEQFENMVTSNGDNEAEIKSLNPSKYKFLVNELEPFIFIKMNDVFTSYLLQSYLYADSSGEGNVS